MIIQNVKSQSDKIVRFQLLKKTGVTERSGQVTAKTHNYIWESLEEYSYESHPGSPISN